MAPMPSPTMGFVGFVGVRKGNEGFAEGVIRYYY